MAVAVAFWEEQDCQQQPATVLWSWCTPGQGAGNWPDSRRLLWLIPGLLCFLGGDTKFGMVAGAALSFSYVTRIEVLGELNQIGSSQ